MSEQHAFDQRKKLIQPSQETSASVLSDEKFDALLQAHYAAMSRPRTLKQKVQTVLLGFVVNGFLLGLAFFLTIPEFRQFLYQLIVQLFK